MASEVKQVRQRQHLLTGILIGVCGLVGYAAYDGRAVLTTWGLTLMMGLVVELSSLRRTMRLLNLLMDER
jgi:hypothetical protein